MAGAVQSSGASSLPRANMELNGGRKFVFDDESFELLSIEVEPALLGRQIAVPTQGVEIRLSQGPASGFRRCRGWVGKDIIGTLDSAFGDDETRRSKTLRVKVELVATALPVWLPAREESGDSVQHRIEEEFIARPVTPFIGPWQALANFTLYPHGMSLCDRF